MTLFKVVAVVLLSIATTVVAQFVSPPTDLTTATGYGNLTIRYKQVPSGICELNPNVNTYAGYVDVLPNQHIFFLFFEARTANASTAPLTVWLNGGPGCSSMYGAFTEIGPCFIDYYGNVTNNPYSWTNVSNMLFIDQPTQVGFSYSNPVPGYLTGDTDDITGNSWVIPLINDTCPSSYVCGTFSDGDPNYTASNVNDAAVTFWTTLQGFFSVFPQYSTSNFNIAGESYFGQYGPAYATYILEQNAQNITGAVNINLKTLLIGNGLFDPQTNTNTTQLFGDPDYNTYDLAFNTNDTDRDNYDIRELKPDPFCPMFFVDYLNVPKVQDAFGAYVNYTFLSAVSHSNIQKTANISTISRLPQIASLLNEGVTVVLYNGDADWACNWRGGEISANNVNATGFADAGYVNITSSDGIVHGQVKQAGSFAFVRIYEAGHAAPYYQPLVSLEMFERALNGTDLATGTQVVTSSYLSVGTPDTTYREGNGTVQWTVLPINATYNIDTNEPNPVN